MNNHSQEMLKTLGKLNTKMSIKKITPDYTIPTQNKYEFIIGGEVTKQKIGKEITHINQIDLGEFVLFGGKICQVTKLFDVSNNARLATENGARNVILGNKCNLFRLLSKHTVGNPVSNDRIGTSVNHISKLKDNQWILYKSKLAQVFNYNHVSLHTDEGSIDIDLDKESLSTVKD